MTRKKTKIARSRQRRAMALATTEQWELRQKKVTVAVVNDKTSEEKMPRRLTWHNKRQGTSGTFSALYEEMLNDVPKELSATPKERIAMYERVKAAINTKRNNNLADSGAVVVDIPWTMLDFPRDGVGREKRVDRGHVGHIVQNYHPGSWAVPVVTMRPVYDEHGTLETVLFEITDGQHRRCIALERAYADRPEDLHTGKNPVKITVSVSEVSSTRETAKSFTDNNAGGKRPMAGTDNWRNMYVAGLPEVVAAVDLAAEYGLDASAPVSKRGWPRCHGKIIMHMCNITFGGGPYEFPWIKEKDVRTALRMITDPECIGVYKNTDSVNKQNFFAGLCHFIAYYYRPGYVHDIGLKHLLAKSDIVERAVELSQNITPDIIQIEMPHVTRTTLSRDETRRYHSVAVALKRMYVAKVPPPKMRSKVDGWPDCPAELRQLFHVAPDIADSDARAKFIADLHKKLDAKTTKRRVKTEKSITR